MAQNSKLAPLSLLLEYTFENEDLLAEALTHRSAASLNNERLEFLGDSVLGFVICSWLYEAYPEYNEGDLTKIKSAVVSRRTCGKIACQSR